MNEQYKELFPDVQAGFNKDGSPLYVRQLLERVKLLGFSLANVEHNRNLLSEEKQKLFEENERLHIDLWNTKGALTVDGFRKYIKRIEEENERLTKERDEQEEVSHNLHNMANEYLSLLQQLREELEQVKKERDSLQRCFDGEMELRHHWMDQAHELRSQLAEKDKVLEWYADKSNWVGIIEGSSNIHVDGGLFARNALIGSQETNE